MAQLPDLDSIDDGSVAVSVLAAGGEHLTIGLDPIFADAIRHCGAPLTFTGGDLFILPDPREEVRNDLSGTRGEALQRTTHALLERIAILLENDARSGLLSKTEAARYLAELSEGEATAILAALPHRTADGRLPVRALFTAMYETTLRRETLFSLRAPDDYTRGGTSSRRLRGPGSFA